MVDIEAMDPTTYDIERLMYLPSCPSDAPYIMRHQDTEFLDADTILATYEDWRDVSTWPASARESKVIKKLATGRQADPLAKGGVIGAFCRAYPISRAIGAFLANVWAGRWCTMISLCIPIMPRFRRVTGCVMPSIWYGFTTMATRTRR